MQSSTSINANTKRLAINLSSTVILLVSIFLCSIILLPSGNKYSSILSEQKDFSSDITSEFLAFKSSTVSSMFEMPRIYLLPWGEAPAPVPNPDGYNSQIQEDGSEILTYEDETITVKYWTEWRDKSIYHFSEIKIAHPTQLRTAYAGGVFGTTTKYTPQTIAQNVNAVVAINADFCGYRSGGILIRQNTLYRNEPLDWDILLIDSNGDFHIMEDKYVESSGILETHDIVNTLVFGPSLVIDGEIKLLNLKSGCDDWNEGHFSPRTAIGQIGTLHYLFCCVEGRTEFSYGIKTSQLAQAMLDHGCVQAYNLDGGKSTTMVFGGKAMNNPLWGGQRVVTDIIYCASAIPNNE